MTPPCLHVQKNGGHHGIWDNSPSLAACRSQGQVQLTRNICFYRVAILRHQARRGPKCSVTLICTLTARKQSEVLSAPYLEYRYCVPSNGVVCRPTYALFQLVYLMLLADAVILVLGDGVSSLLKVLSQISRGITCLYYKEIIRDGAPYLKICAFRPSGKQKISQSQKMNPKT